MTGRNQELEEKIISSEEYMAYPIGYILGPFKQKSYFSYDIFTYSGWITFWGGDENEVLKRVLKKQNEILGDFRVSTKSSYVDDTLAGNH